MPNQKGQLARIAGAVTAAGGNIIALGTFLGDDPSTGQCTLKADGITRDGLEKALRPHVTSVDDIREA
jgi:acetoin utilization protein AcuB